MTLEPDHTLPEIAESLRMSERWVRKQIAEGAECIRRGGRIRMTTEQVEKLRMAHLDAPVKKSITTGKKRRTA